MLHHGKSSRASSIAAVAARGRLVYLVVTMLMLLKSRRKRLRSAGQLALLVIR